MENYVAVDGAVCKCKFSEDTSASDILVVKSQKKHFANDKGANKKLIATTQDINQTLKNGTFGKCTLQPNSSGNKPCMAVITKWQNFYEKVTLSNDGKILTEISKAECPVGGPNCIEIFKHGQTAEVGEQQMQKADTDVLNQINPLVDLEEIDTTNSVCYQN